MTDELTKRIGILERKIQREKLARETAESQLEKFSRQIYFKNLSLEEALLNEKKRSQELEYLIKCASTSQSQTTLIELIRRFVEITSQFCNSSVASFSFPSHGELGLHFDDYYLPEQNKWIESLPASELLASEMPQNHVEASKKWIISPIELALPIQEKPFNWMYYLSFKIDSENIAWICFLSDKEYIDEAMLYVLNTSKEIFLNNIHKTIIKTRLIHRNEELQETIKKLQEAQSQLVQSEKMAVLGQLSAGVAHEINNPISFINSNLQILKEYLTDLDTCHLQLSDKISLEGMISQTNFKEALAQIDYRFIMDDAQEMLASAIDGIKRITDIIKNLKSFTHRGPTDFELTDINECLDSAINIANSGLSSRCHIEKNLPPLSMIHANSGQLQQVFINLFVNAGDAMEPEGGIIKVTAEEVNNHIILRISDSGCGMSEETKKNLFTPFFTTKPVGQGTGLGLSVSFAIIESHSASVDVESVEGEGTTFVLTFNVTPVEVP